MDISLIYELMDRIENSSIDLLEIENDGFRIKLGKNSIINCGDTSTTGYTTGKSQAQATDKFKKSSKSVASGTQIKTKVAGTFYAAAGPDCEPFVTVGKKVKKGDVIGIIEAMKMMNDIVAPVDGVVTQILVNNEQMVGYDELLMTIEENN